MRIPRRLLFVLIAPFLLLVVLSCYNRHFVTVDAVRANGISDGDHVVAVTLIDGRQVNFDGSSRPVLIGDTLRGQVNATTIGFPADSIQRVWFKTLDPVRTTLAVLGTVIGIAGVVSAIALASKQSCPFIYSWDGTQYVFDAEPYGGAITRGLERDDYGELPSLANDHGVYRLLVTNEVNETQYTNRLRLIVIDHAPGAVIKTDEFGHFYAFDSLMAPSAAHDADGRDLRPWLVATDRLVWEPVTPPDKQHGARQEITLAFAKPPAARHAYLVARVSTGLWGSQMIREFSQLRGTALSNWYAAMDTSPTQAAALRQWNLREELYALKIAVDEPRGWVVRGILPGGGPFLATDRVVLLDLAQVHGDSLRIHIRPPYGFWALNSFAIAYDTAATVHVRQVEASTARTHDGRDILRELAATDDRYYAMPTKRDYAYVTFVTPPPVPGMTRSVFVHARGYYRLHMDPVNAPDTTTLARFLAVPDAAAMFAANRFTETHPRLAVAH